MQTTKHLSNSKVHLDNDQNIDYLNSSREPDGNSDNVQQFERENGIIYNEYHKFDVENENTDQKKRRNYDPDEYKDGQYGRFNMMPHSHFVQSENDNEDCEDDQYHRSSARGQFTRSFKYNQQEGGYVRQRSDSKNDII